MRNTNEFEPTNSNLLGEDVSNFSFRKFFRRRKNKKSPAKVVKTTTTTTTTTATPSQGENYPPMNVNIEDVKNAPTHDVTAKYDIQLYGIKNNSKRGLKAGERAIIKLVNGLNDSGVFAIVMQKGGNKDKLQGQYVPAYYHPFSMDNKKSGGKLGAIEDVLKNMFTINVNRNTDSTENTN